MIVLLLCHDNSLMLVTINSEAAGIFKPSVYACSMARGWLVTFATKPSKFCLSYLWFHSMKDAKINGLNKLIVWGKLTLVFNANCFYSPGYVHYKCRRSHSIALYSNTSAIRLINMKIAQFYRSAASERYRHLNWLIIFVLHFSTAKQAQIIHCDIGWPEEC